MYEKYSLKYLDIGAFRTIIKLIECSSYIISNVQEQKEIARAFEFCSTNP